MKGIDPYIFCLVQWKNHLTFWIFNVQKIILKNIYPYIQAIISHVNEPTGPLVEPAEPTAPLVEPAGPLVEPEHLVEFAGPSGVQKKQVISTFFNMKKANDFKIILKLKEFIYFRKLLDPECLH